MRDHSVISDGAPTAPKCTLPDNSPSLMTLGPATFCQFVFTSMPAALACFSIRLSRSISISGRNETPNCCAMVISASSARGLEAEAARSRLAAAMVVNFIGYLGVTLFDGADDAWSGTPPPVGALRDKMPAAHAFSLNSFSALVRPIFCRSASFKGALSNQSAASLMSSNG